MNNVMQIASGLLALSLVGCGGESLVHVAVVGGTANADGAYEVVEGSTVQLSASSDLVEDRGYEWTSSAPQIATVDAQGMLTAVAEGQAEISVTGLDSGAQGHLRVVVISRTSGIPEAILERVSAQDIERLELDLGFTIHRGSTPPTVEGRFYGDSQTLVRSTFEDTTLPGHRFTSYEYQFSDQTEDALYFRQSAQADMGEGQGAYISGGDGAFTVYVITEGVSNGVAYESFQLVSGTITEAGIEQFQLVLYILSKDGDENNAAIIPVGTGRLIEEQDGLAARLP